jgi:hypothetical protein
LNLSRIAKASRSSRNDRPRLTVGRIAALAALPCDLTKAAFRGLEVFTSVLMAPVIALLGRNPVRMRGTASVTVPFLGMAVRNQGIGGAARLCLVASVRVARRRLRRAVQTFRASGFAARPQISIGETP